MKKIISVIFTCVFLVTALAAGNLTVARADEEQEVPKASVVVTQKDEEPEDEDLLIGEPQEEPEDINPLTGEAGFNENVIGKRPVAVMINNHPDSYPQYNISEADVLFEVVVEHDLSRFLAVFADYTNVPYLVSVRSYRYYFPAISEGFDAVYVHWGEDLTMMDYYYSLELDAYDGLSNTYLFGRDQDRLNAGYSLEHTSAFYGYLLPDQLAWDGVDMDLDESHEGNAFSFVPFGTIRIPSEEKCSFIDVQYGKQSTQFVYDEDAHVYRKFANTEPQIDGINGEQLQFSNVLVLYTWIIDREDEPEANRKWLDVMGSKDDDYTTGYYISEGSVQKIRWEKPDEQSRLKFYDENGEEISINRGKTYITFTYQDSAEFSDTVPEEYR